MKKIFFRILTAILISINVFATTVFASPVHKYIDTASEATDIHREGRIGYQYKVINGVLYKRLYDYVADKALSDWVRV